MAYQLPAVEVYQILQNSGGGANTTPDLDVTIIGPAYNVLTYTPGSEDSLIATAALPASTTTGSIDAGSVNLTVAATGSFNVGDTIYVQGAGSLGANLQTQVLSIVGNLVTLNVAAVTAVTDAVVYKSASISNATVANTFSLPGQKPGQTIDLSTVQVWLSTAKVTVFTGAGTGSSGSNAVAITGSPANVNVVTNTLNLQPGDALQIGYTNTSMVTKVFNTSVQTVTTTNGANGNITAITTADIMPADMGNLTALTITANRTFSDQQLASASIDTTNTVSQGTVTIKANPALAYGNILSGEVHFAYKALRADLSAQIQVFNGVADVQAVLGDTTDANPLGLASILALANTVTRVKAIAVETNDLAGYTSALELTEDDRTYFLVPLTQDESIIAAARANADQMSTPQMAHWRVLLANTAIPTTQSIGTASKVTPATGATIVQTNSDFILTDANGTFISDGLIPGDTISVTAATPAQVISSYTVLNVISNQQVKISATIAATGVSYYATRKLTKDQKAKAVAAVSTTFNDKRVVHVQPDTVGVSVNGVTKYLPGYYLCAALGGMGAGFPVQQGFTNITVAGIVDLKNSNFFFTRAQLDTMAAAGTLIFVQATQGAAPYVRHELTTDMSVLENRELLVVKNWDYLAYYFKDLISPFIGTWNITRETINNIRQTLTAGAEYLKNQKLPKIGAPLIDYKINSIAQDANNKDNLNVNMSVSLVYPNNTTNIYLVI